MNDTEKIAELQRWVRAQRQMIVDVREVLVHATMNVYTTMKQENEQDKLSASMDLLEHVCDDIEKLLRGEQLPVTVTIVDLG